MAEGSEYEGRLTFRKGNYLFLKVSAGGSPPLASRDGEEVVLSKLTKALMEVGLRKSPRKDLYNDLELYDLAKDHNVTDKGSEVLGEVQIYKSKFTVKRP